MKKVYITSGPDCADVLSGINFLCFILVNAFDCFCDVT